MSHYLTEAISAKKTPQSRAIPGREAVMQRNNAGGFSFKADSFTRLERFAIIGSSGGTYYVSEQDLTKSNIDNVMSCIKEDGKRTVDTIAQISVSGRAPKNDPAIYVLALAASLGSAETQAYALSQLSKVCRIATHLFRFAEFIDNLRGWGPALRRAVAAWYTDKPSEKLAYQLVKYQQRNGWSHSDLLRLAHPKPTTEAHIDLLRYVRKGVNADTVMPAIITGFEAAKGAEAKEVVRLIREYGLTREMIPTEVQKDPAVWEALLEKMPMTAMIRSLGRMGACGLLAPMSECSKHIVKQLGDRDALYKARIHPIQVLSALLTYKTGHGLKGSLSWAPVPQVVDALGKAFYDSFSNVEPTGKNFYLGVDVSSSMRSGEVAGVAGLTPNMGAAAMAMLIARTEPNYFIGGFSHKFVELGISKADRLDAAMQKTQMSFGGTDCSIAINHALANKYPVDAFVIISDGESWAGTTHTSQALVNYRQKMGRDSKLIVINMVANRTSLADPKDEGSIDIVGFDASVPTIIAGFLGKDARVESEE